jgi:hypothetical protein
MRTDEVHVVFRQQELLAYITSKLKSCNPRSTGLTVSVTATVGKLFRFGDHDSVHVAPDVQKSLLAVSVQADVGCCQLQYDPEADQVAIGLKTYGAT